MVIMLGGAIGSALRYALSTWVGGLMAGFFPWGTLAVNIFGSFVIGLFVGLAQIEGVWWSSPDARAFIVVGVLGGFTTFSAFSLQTMLLFQSGQALYALGNILLSVLLCLLATAGGFLLAGSLLAKS